MITLADIFEALDPIVDGLFVIFLIVGFCFTAPKQFAIVTGMIICGLILFCLFLMGFVSAISYFSPALAAPVGGPLALAVFTFVACKIRAKMFPEKDDKPKDN